MPKSAVGWGGHIDNILFPPPPPPNQKRGGSTFCGVIHYFNVALSRSGYIEDFTNNVLHQLLACVPAELQADGNITECIAYLC